MSKRKMAAGMDTLALRNVRTGFYIHMDRKGEVRIGNDCIGMQARWVRTNRKEVVTWLRYMLYEMFERINEAEKNHDDPNSHSLYEEFDTLAYCLRALQRRRLDRKPIYDQNGARLIREPHSRKKSCSEGTD